VSFTIKPEHRIIASNVTERVGFFTIATEEACFRFLADNRATVRMSSVRQNTDVDFNYTLTITPKKTA